MAEKYPFTDFLLNHLNNPALAFYATFGHSVYVFDETKFLDTCRFDDGGMFDVLETPTNLRVRLDSFEAKYPDNHEVTIADLRKLVQLPALARLGLISIESVGPTQVVIDESLPSYRHGDILSGTIFSTKAAALKKYYTKRLSIPR